MDDAGNDQERIERHARELLGTPPVRRAMREGEAALRRAIPEADAASLACLPASVTEIALNALVAFVDGRLGEDRPRLTMRPPRRGPEGMLPGTRGLHDNPDTFYRIVPLDGASDFVLTVRAPERPATVFELSVLSADWRTLSHLGPPELALGPDARVRIHVGREPGAAADHFMATAGDAEMLILRETLVDWGREMPSRIGIENRVVRGGARERDEPAFVEAAARRVEKWFRESVRLTQAPLERPANRLPEPAVRNEHGMLVTMAYSIGHYRLARDEALILRVDPGSAAYAVAPVTSLWGATGAALARGASWSSGQAPRDADGRFTCVLSHEDPGVTPWLETEGRERGFLFLRWAGLDPERASEGGPGVETRLVRLADLPDALPEATPRIDPQGRRSLRLRREREHARRYAVLQTASGLDTGGDPR